MQIPFYGAQKFSNSLEHIITTIIGLINLQSSHAIKNTFNILLLIALCFLSSSFIHQTQYGFK